MNFKTNNLNEIDSFLEVNPNYDSDTLVGYKDNCVGCSINYLLSKLGIKTTTKASLDIDPVSGLATVSGKTFDKIEKAFEGCTTSKAKVNDWKEITNKLLSENPNGSFGVIGNTRNNKMGLSTKHAIAWEIQNGKVVYTDAQSGSSLYSFAKSNGFPNHIAKQIAYEKLHGMSENVLNKISNFSEPFEFIRIDNATAINVNALHEFVY